MYRTKVTKQSCASLSSTYCHALHCVSSHTYYFLLICVSVFIHTIFGEPPSNSSSFTTHQMFMHTLLAPCKRLAFFHIYINFCISKVFLLNILLVKRVKLVVKISGSLLFNSLKFFCCRDVQW